MCAKPTEEVFSDEAVLSFASFRAQSKGKKKVLIKKA